MTMFNLLIESIMTGIGVGASLIILYTVSRKLTEVALNTILD